MTPTMKRATTDTRSPRSRNEFIVVGEAPGRIEDYQGKPFVGPAGQLLRSRLTDVGLNPESAYFINSVCCWPHGTPSTDHIQACRTNLRAQWEAAPPRYALVLGHTALKALVPHTQPKYCRGVGFGMFGKVIFPTWHPAAFAPGRNSIDPTKWHRHLEVFGMIVRGEVEPEPVKCIYCDKDRAAYAPTCFTHVSKYRLDNQWSLPVQGELDV